MRRACSTVNPRSCGSLRTGWGTWLSIHFELSTTTQAGMGRTPKDRSTHLGTHNLLLWLGLPPRLHRSVRPRSKASVAGWLNSLLLKHLTEKNLGTTGAGRKNEMNLSQNCCKIKTKDTYYSTQKVRLSEVHLPQTTMGLLSRVCFLFCLQSLILQFYLEWLQRKPNVSLMVWKHCRSPITCTVHLVTMARKTTL